MVEHGFEYIKMKIHPTKITEYPYWQEDSPEKTMSASYSGYYSIWPDNEYNDCSFISSGFNFSGNIVIALRPGGNQTDGDVFVICNGDKWESPSGYHLSHFKISGERLNADMLAQNSGCTYEYIRKTIEKIICK